ncbi:MAG: hypothetical protein ACLFR1_07960 [Spirochaetia bacterium]
MKQNSQGAATIESTKAVVKVKSEADQDKLESCLEKTLKTYPVGVLYEKAGIKIDHKLVKL